MIKKVLMSLFTLLVYLNVLILAGCGSSADNELTRYIVEVKLRKPKPIESIPELPPVEKFKYPENDTRRSPFKPKEKIMEGETFAPNTNRPKEPLESYPLDALKFVGILKQGSTIWALIKLPGDSGEVARVRVGNYMGKNYGKVLEITDKTVKLEELIQLEGRWKKQVTVLTINTTD